VSENDDQRWLPPLSDKLASGPFIIREAPAPGTSQYVYGDKGEVKGLLIVQPPPPRNWLEAKCRSLRWHLTMLRRHGMWG
jgi:hypothetical protein